MEKPLTPEPQASAPVARRTFLKATGAAAAGLAGILESGRAPAWGPEPRRSTSCTGWTSCRPATKS